jgi:hypothetical protein
MAKSAAKTAEKILNSGTPEQYCIDSGINLLDIYKELGSIALTAEVYSKNHDGSLVSLGPDVRARTTAIALILELNKHLKDKGTTTQVSVINDPNVRIEVDRLRGLIKSD